MSPTYYAAIGGAVVVIVIVFLIRQRGSRQRLDVSASALGTQVRVKSSVEPEMQRIKAGRDVKAAAGAGDPARMADVEAGRDVIRDTTADDPKARRP